VSNQEIENNSWKVMYRNGMIVIVLGFILSFLILGAGWFGWLNYFSDKPEIWFQRSGSLMTVVLLVSDYYVYKLLSDVGESNMIPQFAMRTKDAYRKYVKVLPYFAVSLTVLATFIWGYGDLVFLQVN
jgi:cytochrome c biogenesis protein CcdA